MAPARHSTAGPWIATLLAVGTTLAVVLLIQTVLNYRYISDSLIQQEARQVAQETIRIAERAARLGRFQDAQAAASLFDELRAERADYLAWLLLRQGAGTIVTSAGNPGLRPPGRRRTTDSRLDRHQAADGRDLLVGTFPCRCGVGDGSANPGDRGGERVLAFVEIGLFRDGLSAPSTSPGSVFRPRASAATFSTSSPCRVSVTPSSSATCRVTASRPRS